MPIDSSDLDTELSAAEQAFDEGGREREPGLVVADDTLVQLRKACRSLAGARALYDGKYYTLIIEAAFTSIEKTLLFLLIREGHRKPTRPPGSHTTAIRRSVEVGVLTEAIGHRLIELWETNRARTYYQDAIATKPRADALLELASTLHDLVIRLAGASHECVCERTP